ncbi:DsbA family protein [Sorangium cellulosum]|uniref:DsbA family protein n=1 Tax=Sorangium cellulosum TaxID=56 RepID=UPI001F5E050A|nr:thioredoxin domain-containing protein [Sorangium cellulosum]
MLGVSACYGAGAAHEPGGARAADEESDLYSDIPQDGVTLGDPGAPITLTEFSDLRCSHCRNYALAVLPVILDRHVRPGQVKLVFRNLAFLGPGSVRAARMASAVGMQDRLWDFVDRLFRLQARERPAAITDDLLLRVAAELPGVDAARAAAEQDSGEVDRQLEAARAEARRLQIRGVPAFFLSRAGEEPRRLRLTSMSPEPFSRAIEQLLAAPRTAPARGR